MAETENKVQFNLKNVHYATFLTEGASPTWESPKPIPGAVSLTLSQVGDITKFFADGLVYWQGASNNGYEGEFELARVPDEMYEDVWGMTTVMTDNVLIENVNDRQKNFALLFQIDGDANDQLYCLYNCTASRPGIDAKTNEESKAPQTQKLSFSCAPLTDGKVKASTTAATEQSVRTSWFTAVYENK